MAAEKQRGGSAKRARAGRPNGAVDPSTNETHRAKGRKIGCLAYHSDPLFAHSLAERGEADYLAELPGPYRVTDIETETPVAPFAGVPDPLRSALEKRGFTQLTAVQAAVLRAITEGDDQQLNPRISSQAGSGQT